MQFITRKTLEVLKGADPSSRRDEAIVMYAGVACWPKWMINGLIQDAIDSPVDVYLALREAKELGIISSDRNTTYADEDGKRNSVRVNYINVAKINELLKTLSE